MSTVELRRTIPDIESLQAPPDPRARPVVGWAVVGGIFLAFIGFTLTKWVVGGQAVATPIGPDSIPTYMRIATRTYEVASVFAALAIAYWFGYKPWRQDRRIGFDQALIIGAFMSTFQDCFCNLAQNWVTYNAGFFNLGSWYGSVPGWSAPNSNLVPEPLIWASASYVHLAAGAIILACHILRRCRERWPHISTFRLLLGTYVAVFFGDLIFETTVVYLGFYAYPGAIRKFSLFAGHYYQFPLYESVLIGVWFTGWVALRFFKDDKGQTIAERGIDRVRVPSRMKSSVRFLAVTGALQFIMLVGFTIPMILFGLHAEPWPKDFEKRSYLTNGICGPGTDYACSGPDVPIPRRDSKHVNPSGQLVD